MSNPQSKLSTSIVPVIVFAGLLLALAIHRTNWVMEPSGIRPSKLNGVPKLGIPQAALALGSIDTAGRQGEINAARGATVEISGWATSSNSNLSVKSIVLCVDGHPSVSTGMFFSRPDVAYAYGRDDFDLSGWKTLLPAPENPGRYELTQRVALSDGRMFSLPPVKLNIH